MQQLIPVDTILKSMQLFQLKALFGIWKPKKSPTKSQAKFLEGFHSMYDKYVCGNGVSMTLLEFGGSPAVFSLISASKRVDSITFSEYAESI